jgi:hypothetical protein
VKPDGSDFAALAFGPTLSADGRYVTFSVLVPNTGPPLEQQLYRRDLLTGTTVSLGAGQRALMSQNGTVVAIVSEAGVTVGGTLLESGWPPSLPDVNRYGTYLAYVDRDGHVRRRNVNTGQDEIVSIGADGNTRHGYDPSISDDGTKVAFSSDEPDVVPGDTDDAADVFVRDTVRGVTMRVSLNFRNGNPFCTNHEQREEYFGYRLVHACGGTSADISGDGLWVAYFSMATNIVHEDFPLWGLGVSDAVYVRGPLSPWCKITGRLYLCGPGD